jgi:hypothetical protein
MTTKPQQRLRILTHDSLSDEHAYVGAMLLTLAKGDPLSYTISVWVAVQMFELDELEWRAALAALAAANIITVTWDSPSRATITFTEEAS